MKLEEILLLKSEPSTLYKINSVQLKWGEIVINDKIAIPIEKYASYFNTSTDISILDQSNDEIGLLCFTKEKGLITESDLTENQLIAFLTEANYSTEEGRVYQFTNNYVVINESFYETYKEKYRDTAPFWGGFYHKLTDLNTNSHTITVPKIELKEIDPQFPIVIENSIRAIAQPYAFERFLKFYHLLELLFDLDVINKIKELNIETESEKIGELLNDYSKKELTRLEAILDSGCHDIPALVMLLNKSSNFEQISTDLFFKFGSTKEGNPFNGQESKFPMLIRSSFEEAKLKSSGVHYQKDFRKFIIKLVSFWIYRIRGSVAHNKIGEYILSMGNEKYIVEFGEPLLKEVISQCFKK